MFSPWPRLPPPSDGFNAIAEPRRRDILDFLAARERPVGDIVQAFGLAQPSVSKHLRVLRDVGLVTCAATADRLLSHQRRGHPPLHEWTTHSSATGGSSSCASRNAPSATEAA